MSAKDIFQILRNDRTKLVNRVADLETENNRMRMQLRKAIRLHQAVKSVVEDAAFNQLAPETQLKLREAEIPVGGWGAALKRIKAFLED